MAVDPSERREQMLANWDRAAAGWGRRADSVRDQGMALSQWMVQALELQPGQRVLELAAGPGDTGFLAAKLIAPGQLICSDASQPMLDLAKARAREQAIGNVEFKQLQLEWIDLPTASVDAILCRWGLMLSVDPAAALHECRRVLVPGGRLALAVWDLPERNPWATIPIAALIARGRAEPPDPSGPGMFALSDSAGLEELVASAGFVEWTVGPIALVRSYDSVGAWVAEQVDLSMMFSDAWAAIDAEEQAELVADIRRAATPYTDGDGRVRLPGSSLAAVAHA